MRLCSLRPLSPQVLLVALLSCSAFAQVDSLVAEALAVRPELAQAQADLDAARARVPQVTSWSDPMLEVALQHDGFRRWNVGTDPMSWISLMAKQSIPFPGKNPLRAELATVDVRQAELALDRARLSTTAEVRRAYLQLQAAREKTLLLTQLQALWNTTRAAAQARYETGQGSQAEVVRVRLEESRLAQRARRLALEEQTALRALNRLRAKPLATPVEAARLTAFPTLAAHDLSLSPELAIVSLGRARADSELALRRRSLFPDLELGAGVMVRGPLEPMWTVSLGVPLPIFSGLRLDHETREAELRVGGAVAGAEELEQRLTLAHAQRSARLSTLAELWKTSSAELVVQATAASEVALIDYRSGRGTLLFVLEASSALVAEHEAALETLVEAWDVVIEQDELLPGES